MSSAVVERFAPSPTGPLHLGHAFSALMAWDSAVARDGTLLLRIEDIDRSRARAGWETQIFEDLHWLGLDWPEPPLRQSSRMRVYHTALQSLWDRGLLYPCTCNRRDIEAAVQAPQEGPIHGPDGLIYPGTCRKRFRGRTIPAGAALRLDMRRAVDGLGRALKFEEIGDGAQQTIIVTERDLVKRIGDVVLARRELGTSYHLSVVLDDAFQSVTHVTRGTDLFEATKIHILLQRLLGLPTPVYRHHRLIRDETGKRLAKRDDARAISKYREDGLMPHDIRRLVDLPDPST